MIDIKLLREDPEKYTEAAERKLVRADISGLLAVDAELRGARQQLQEIAKRIDAPGDRSGNPIHLKLDEGDELVGDAILDLVPDFRLDPINQRLFGFERAGSYDLPYDTTDQRLLAHEYEDFAQAIRDDREPEVDGQDGLMATAFAYALCESGQLGKPVKLSAVAADEVNAYQAEINEYAGV